MFHYRNHGAAYSRVFMGVQVDEAELKLFNEMLDSIGFRYWDETDNPAYQQFLCGK
jgi:threonine dehydratase